MVDFDERVGTWLLSHVWISESKVSECERESWRKLESLITKVEPGHESCQLLQVGVCSATFARRETRSVDLRLASRQVNVPREYDTSHRLAVHFCLPTAQCIWNHRRVFLLDKTSSRLLKHALGLGRQNAHTKCDNYYNVEIKTHSISHLMQPIRRMFGSSVPF